MSNYEQVQKQIEKLSEVDLLKVIDFIEFLNYKKAQKPQHRFAIFEELRTKNISEKFGDALAWQKEVRQDRKLEKLC
jgi:hypothetical protein